MTSDNRHQPEPTGDALIFVCEHGHELKIWSSDPYYPDMAMCQLCGQMMTEVIEK